MKATLLALDEVKDDVSDGGVKLRDALSGYIGHARKVSTTRKRRSAASSSGPSARELRDWARSNGYEVSDRGRVPAEVREAFEAAVIRYFAQKHPGNTLSKGIVDWRGENGDYAERPVVHGMWKGWQARAALSADAGEELRLYRWLKDNGRELLTSACQGGWRYAISGEPAPQNWHATADDAIRAAIAANQSGKGGE